MDNENPNSREPFEGFIIDLLNELANMVGFRYRIDLVPDGNYGARLESGEWNGMVREVIDRVSDRVSRQAPVHCQAKCTISRYGSRQTLTSPSGSILCMMRLAHAGFLSDTTHNSIVTLEFVCRMTVPDSISC